MPVPNNYLVLSDGKFDDTNGIGPAGLTQAFVDISATGKPLAIYFHGGLVPLASGLASANNLDPQFTAAGSSPLFVVWETGIFEVLRDSLPSIFSEAIFNTILGRVTQFVQAKLDQTQQVGATRAIDPLNLTRMDIIQTRLHAAKMTGVLFPDTPIDRLDDTNMLTPAEEAQIQKEVVGDLQLQIQTQQVANTRHDPTTVGAKGVAVQGSTATLMDTDVLDDIAPAQAGEKGAISMIGLGVHIVKVVIHVIQRFVKHRDHGAYLTIIEEILREFYIGNAGQFVWGRMKQEVSNSFGASPDCGGSALVSEIETMWAAGNKPRVTLIGHSAGSTWVSLILKQLHTVMPADFTVEVALIAPACTFSVFADAIGTAASRVARLRIFGQGDSYEIKNAIAGPLYPASLLYFISGVLEDQSDEPVLGMQRYYMLPVYDEADFPEIGAAETFAPLKLPHGFAWSDIVQGAGANCDMHTHGGWQQAPETMASILSIVAGGIS
jgi:hypothetical protein